MEIDTETIMKIENLRIKISEQDTVGIKKDLNLIVEFVKKPEVNTEGVNEFGFGQMYKEDVGKTIL